MARERKRRTDNRSLWDRFWKDRYGKVVVYQHPNFLLIAWAVLTVISLFVPYGWPQKATWIISILVLIVWGIWEALRGVNLFRKSLGAVVLLLAVLSLFT